MSEQYRAHNRAGTLHGFVDVNEPCIDLTCVSQFHCREVFFTSLIKV